MRHKIERLFAFLTIFSLCVHGMSQTNEKVVEALFHEFDQADVPGAAVSVIQGGTPILAKGYGLADLQKKIPCTTDTNFRLASLTKQFTAMAVLILAEQGKLSLEDHLPKFSPEFPQYGKTITIRHLLTHRSGLLDYEDYIPQGTTIPLSDRDVLFILQQQNKTNFPPGSQFHYSNSAYALLALLVENVSGKTFSAFLKERIFEPLGMTNTIAYVAGLSSVPHRAYGYANGKSGWELSDQSATSAVLGDGGIYSSVADLFKWDQALYTEQLVSRRMVTEALSAHSSQSDFKGSGYGYGWYVGKFRGAEHVWHYGSTCGFSTKINRFPERKLSVIVLANRRNADISPIMEKLIERFW
jgi:CubicO group peptidase (beta-lactamase class C family)